jgi:N-acetylmuramoyl-L-alanine amidase
MTFAAAPFKLAIDPGHGFGNVAPGRFDPGALGGGLREADVTLQWALTGKWVLEQRNIPHWLTRDDDSDNAPLSARDERAKQAGCTHYLSLHCNSASSSASGIEAFYRDAGDQNFASLVLDPAIQAIQLPNRGLKAEGQTGVQRLAVLDFQGPATLLELGFITNESDRARLSNRDVRIAFWELLAGALEV